MHILEDAGFTRLLVLVAGAVSALCLTWLAAIVVAALLEARSGGRVALLRLTGCPPAWRRRLLRLLVPMLAPGLGLATMPWATAAHLGDPAADPVPGSPGAHGGGRAALPGPDQALTGLPLPELPTGHRRSPRRPIAAGPASVVAVRPGDSLWDIAARTLPDDASPADVAERSARLYRLNRAVIGSDPDLIHPGQRLRLPAALAGRHVPTHLAEEADR
jgi:hypothetical protein